MPVLCDTPSFRFLWRSLQFSAGFHDLFLHNNLTPIICKAASLEMELGLLFVLKNSCISLILVLSNHTLLGWLGIMSKCFEESGTYKWPLPVSHKDKGPARALKLSP